MLQSWIARLRRQRWTGGQIAHALHLSASTVARALRRQGLARLRQLAPPVPVRRYQWAQPGELLHLDVKKLGRIGRVGHRITGDRRARTRGIGWEFVHVAIDDASRLAYVEVLGDETGVTATQFLWRALAWFRRHGIRVRRVMTDNGSGYRADGFAPSVAAPACAISARVPIRRARMARLSASSKPCCESGPIGARTPLRSNAPKHCRRGSTTTMVTAGTVPFAVVRPSASWRPRTISWLFTASSPRCSIKVTRLER